MTHRNLLFLALLVLFVGGIAVWLLYRDTESVNVEPPDVVISENPEPRAMTEPPEPIEKQLEPEQTAALTGTVIIEETGESAEAEIRLIPVEGDMMIITAFTESDGSFSFRDLPPNTYQVFAEAPGLLSFSEKKEMPVVVIGKDKDPPKPLVLSLKPAAGVTIRVVSKETGKAIPGAHVRVSDLLRLYRTGMEGEVRLYLPPEIWRLTVRADGYRAREVLVGFSGQTARSYQVALSPEEQKSGKIPLSGAVVDEAGNPISDARLLVRTTGLEEPPEASLDPSGTFEIDRPRDGDTLIFQAPGYAPYWVRDWSQDQSNLRIVLKKYLVFHGRVVDGHDDRPVTRFTLNESKHTRGAEIVAEDGVFQLENLHPDDPVYVTVTANGFAEQRFGPFDAGRTTESDPAVLRLEPLQETPPKD